MSKNVKITENLGLALKHYRTERGFSLQELGNLAQVSSSYINRIELGERKSPSVTLLHRIAIALNVPIENLLEIAEPKGDKSTPSFIELVLKNDFIINGKIIKRDTKENIIALFEFIVDTTWENKDKNREIYELLDNVDRFKRAL